jgi:hypothetical protein
MPAISKKLNFQVESAKWYNGEYPYDWVAGCQMCLSAHANRFCLIHPELSQAAAKAALVSLPSDYNSNRFLSQVPLFRALRRKFAKLYPNSRTKKTVGAH